jgi:ribosome-associated protein
MIPITATVALSETELEFTFLPSPGPGGQNVNKVATAVQLRFNLFHTRSLPEVVRLRLIVLLGPRVTKDGALLIKASRFRTQERNKQDALNRLIEWIKKAAIPPRKRKKTKPSFGAKQRRLDNKKQHGEKKFLRQKI